MKHVNGYTAGEQTATKKNIATSDLIHFSGNWVWRAVEALVQAKDFNPDPVWIADRLNISAEAAKDALEGLVRIGLVTVTTDGIQSRAEFIEANCNDLERSDLFQIHSKIKNQISEKMTHRDSYSNAIVLTKGKYMNEFYRKFSALVAELAEKSAEDKESNEVFALELSLARISRTKE
ncbi:MAG: DUF4423 domain-containing protein [Bdellovibrionales bacterium]|nr:DUF4423 domain-containing protein [Bdellovibrionales bacterium]